MQNRYLDFLLTVLMRCAAGVVAGAFIGMMVHFPHFVHGAAGRGLPWHLLRNWAIGGAVVLLLTLPKEHRPWRKRG